MPVNAQLAPPMFEPKTLRRPQVVVIGNSVVDLYMLGLSKWPGTGRRGIVHRVEYHIGGSGLNVAVNLAKLSDGGLDITLLTAIGHGGHSKFLRAACEFHDPQTKSRKLRRPVNLIPAHVPRGVHTPISVVSLDGESEPSFLHACGASEYLTAEFVADNKKLLEAADCIVVNGIGIQPELSLHDLSSILSDVRSTRQPAVVGDDLKTARTPFVFGDVVLTESASEEMPHQRPLDLGSICGHFDFFFPNEAEAKVYACADDVEQAGRALASKTKTATIVTMGAQGALIYRPDTSGNGARRLSHGQKVPQDPIDPRDVRDATGAGDAFLAGFLAAYCLHSQDLPAACRVANAVARDVVQGFGSTTRTKPLGFYL